MISYIEKGWEEEEYTYNPDSESRSPDERRLKEVEVEGSFGAGTAKDCGSSRSRLVSVRGLRRCVV